ncbi:hypothetical protein [Mannheimia pernigra]|uniref:Uncharacterized protein n=1 Tax=Mannheimia pernigra TaxID=111844 RepID=A0A7H8UU12_9PAST|nr:hypothetical protein [Mannheimia pernigra]QLB40318.1 hypothetical protein HV559_05265 [Mannheimia pernigra]QLB44196.1 hypothetical protein HV561_05275 [Mannheimia pernigra]
MSIKIQNTPRKIVPEQVTFSKNSPVYIPLFFSDKTIKVQSVWELELENGERDAGKVKRNRIQFNCLPVGCHKLTVISGIPLLGQGTKICECLLYINE